VVPRADLAFILHGENLLMVLEDHVPVRMFLKDIGEEVAVRGDRPLPADVERIRAVVLDEDGVLAGAQFWHSCLNRLQLRNTLQMVDLTDQAESLILAGTLANPVARTA
jgi:siderophore synthetase component